MNITAPVLVSERELSWERWSSTEAGEGAAFISAFTIRSGAFQ